MGIEQLVAQCGDLIQAGQSDSVQKMLSNLLPESVPRSHRREVAALCRRVGLLNTGFKLLTPIVRSPQESEEPTPKELAEYAMLLEKAGSLAEALQILERVHLPEANLNRGFCYSRLGEHHTAATHFEAYLRKSDTTDAIVLRGRLGLAAAWISSGKIEQARTWLDEILVHPEIAQYPQILASASELRAQANIHAGRFAEARRDLQLAGPSKWTRILDALEAGRTDILMTYRKEAEERGEWESVREADRFLLKLQFDEQRFNWLLFGTPYPSFRREVMREHQREPKIKEICFGHTNKGGASLNLRTGECAGVTAPPRLVHLLINALLKDFYRPISTGALFAELFIGESFDVFSSIHRIHQAVHRARKWIESRQLPIEIVEKRGHYSLLVHGSFSIVVPFERGTLDAESRRIHALIQEFGSDGFTAREARERLNLTPAVFKSLVTWAEQQGQITRIGAGPSTRYRIKIL
jgi:tetratricopeptide (TPR) repeat protein